MDYIGDAKYVLLGEASHGTHEYYVWRAKITQRLIQEKGFSFVGVEGDWPDCYRLNRYAKGYENSGQDIYSVLNQFKSVASLVRGILIVWNCRKTTSG